MSAIETLSEIIVQRGKASHQFFLGNAGFDQLAKVGLIQVQGVVQSIICEACDDPHDTEVVYVDGTYGAFCSEIGFVPLETSNVQAIKPDIGKLVSELANTFDCKRRKSTRVLGNTWRIGAIDTPAGDLVLYFHPSLQHQKEVAEVQAAFSSEVNAAFRLVLTAIGKLTVSEAKAATLCECVELLEDTNRLAAVADLRTIARAPQAAKNGPKSPYASKLAPMIAQRSEVGDALRGRNEEAKAIAQIYRAKFPTEKVPSLVTIKNYVTNFRTGS